MRDNVLNRDALREARETVACFEEMYGITSDEMLACAQDDPRIAGINSFEMMDWHYALEEVAAFDTRLDTLRGMGETSAPNFFHYKQTSRSLVNTTEPELLLVA